QQQSGSREPVVDACHPRWRSRATILFRLLYIQGRIQLRAHQILLRRTGRVRHTTSKRTLLCLPTSSEGERRSADKASARPCSCQIAVTLSFTSAMPVITASWITPCPAPSCLAPGVAGAAYVGRGLVDGRTYETHHGKPTQLLAW